MKSLLSFAVGAILGDIFFHLIPESYHNHLVELNVTRDAAHRKVGLSIIAGIFMFIIVEIILEKWSQQLEKTEVNKEKEISPSNQHQIEETEINNNNNDISFTNQQLEKVELLFDENQNEKKPKESVDSQIVEVAGYLSLIANGFDNFTHGLAIGASFLVGFKVGLLTTFVIFIHEVPHEICDYAILVNSGFSRWDAVKAQSSVSLFGILGTALALYVKSLETLQAKTLWILPFSAGGFLYIALVNLLPEILDFNRTNPLGQIICLLLGIVFMAIVAIV